MTGAEIKRIYGIRGLVPENIDLKDDEKYSVKTDSSEVGMVLTIKDGAELIYLCKFKTGN